MPKRGHIRHGSLQFYPRKRANKLLPRVRWKSFPDFNKGLMGFIGYKVGMASAYVRDNTPNSLTKGRRITIPVTIIECPSLKILSVRFYNKGKLMGEILNSDLDKELKRKIKIRKDGKANIDSFKKEYDNVRIVVYSQVKKTGIKKKPDVSEIGISGNLDEKLDFVKKNLDKEISIRDYLNEEFMKEGLLDFRGVTKGKGLQGPTKRFGLNLNFHKKEKGVRGPGSGGPWHPARVDFTQPMAGQMGFFTRVVYNNKLILVDNIAKRDINPGNGFKKYGTIKNDFIVVYGSVQGPSKRQLLITNALRPAKSQTKKNYEFLELR